MLSGLTVGQVMMTEFHTLAPADPLARAVEHAIASGQHDFPLVEHGQVVGILRHADLLDGLSKTGAASPVGDAMRRKFRPVRPSEDVEQVLERLHEDDCRTLPVLRDGQLVGLLTSGSLGEYVVTQTQLNRSMPHRPGNDDGRPNPFPEPLRREVPDRAG